jgi:hypothetical protein
MPRNRELTGESDFEDGKHTRFGEDDDYRGSSQHYSSGRSGREHDRSRERSRFHVDPKQIQRHAKEPSFASGARYPSHDISPISSRGSLHTDDRGRWIEHPNSKSTYPATRKDLEKSRAGKHSTPTELNFDSDYFHRIVVPQRSNVPAEEQSVSRHSSHHSDRSKDKGKGKERRH